MDESELLFNLLYLLVCMCIVYPPEEFQRIGLTIEQMASNWLGCEHLNFVLYHQRRTALNLLVHSCLPALYFVVHNYKFTMFIDGGQHNVEDDDDGLTDLDPDFPMPQEAVVLKTLVWKVAQRFSLLAILAVPAITLNWYHQNWRRHPITHTLAKFTNETQNNVDSIVSEVNTEIRRPQTYRKKLNVISNVFATDNWIIKTSLYTVHFARQDECSLSVAKMETYNVSHDNSDTLQMISIAVRPTQTGISSFQIRINALEFRNLEEKLTRPIHIPSNIHFHQNIIDRFIEVFKTQVSQNPKYKTDDQSQIADKCFACIIAEPNIKIHKQCTNVDLRTGEPLSTENACTNCCCRPMWCVDCLARWFASRQADYDCEVWLEQKCTCPMCRAKFCLLDVSYLEKSSTTSTSSNSGNHQGGSHSTDNENAGL